MLRTRREILTTLLVGTLAPAAGWAATSPVGSLRFQRLRHATLLLELGRVRVLVDPWLSRGPGGGLVVDTGAPAHEDALRLGRVDLLLLTSSTWDRLDASTLRRLEDKNARCLVPDAHAAKVLRRAGFSRVRAVSGEEEWRTVGVDVKTVTCRASGVLPSSLGFHLTCEGRSVFIAGALPPLVVDDTVGRFARDHAAEVAFLPRPHVVQGIVDPTASDEDLLLVARLCRARALVPYADALRPGALASPLVSLVVENRDPLMASVEGEKGDGEGERGGLRIVHVDERVWYRLAIDREKRRG